MRIRLHQADIAEAFMERHYPKGFKSQDATITEYIHQGHFFFGQGTYKELFFEGIHIGYGNLAPHQNTRITFESDFETVEMHFALAGVVSTRSEDGRLFAFGHNQHNILYANGFKGHTDWGHASMQVFEVNLLPSVFKKYLPEDSRLFEQFDRMIGDRQTGFLAPHNYPISPAMHFLIHEIICCQREGIFKKAFIEAKVIELLLLQLEQISADPASSVQDLKAQDIDKMYAIKEMLEQNLQETYKLTDLARHVGTNEFTLKKGFKALFGTTVFDYRRDLKMEKARKLLLEEGLNVREVSEEIGYTYAHHFSTAFKKKYGMLPSVLKGK